MAHAPAGVISLCPGQLLNGGQILNPEIGTMKFRNPMLAKIRKRPGNSLARHANDLADLFVSQRHLDSARGGRRWNLMGPVQHQAGDSLGRRRRRECAKLGVRLLALAA